MPKKIKIRAKVTVESVVTHNGIEQVRMRAVHGGDKNAEDNTYAGATPVADVTMQIDRKDAQGYFQEGSAYHLDFTAADGSDDQDGENAYPAAE